VHGWAVGGRVGFDDVILRHVDSRTLFLGCSLIVKARRSIGQYKRESCSSREEYLKR